MTRATMRASLWRLLGVAAMILSLASAGCGSGSRPAEVVAQEQPTDGATGPGAQSSGSEAGTAEVPSAEDPLDPNPIDPEPADPVELPESLREYFPNVVARVDSVLFDPVIDSVFEALPNTSFDNQGEIGYVSDIAVVGTVLSVEPLTTFADPSEHPDLAGAAGHDQGGIPVDHDDPRALWRTYTATVAVREVLGLSPGTVVANTVGFKVTADAILPINTVRAALLANPNVVVLGTRAVGEELDGSMPFRVGFNGAFWFLIDVDGGLRAPGMPADYAERFGLIGLTLEELRGAAAQPPQTLLPHWERTGG